MKTIRSNPLGFGIHSPYVYHLVTRVLFGKHDPLRNKVLLSFPINSQRRRELRTIVRLTDHFRPERIIFSGKEEETLLLRTFFPEIPVLSSLPEETRAGNVREMIISASPAAFPEDIPAYGEEACWILRNCGNFEMKRLFDKLRLSKDVPLTIEVKNTAIIVFSWKFRKQDYVVKRFHCF